MPNGTTAQQPTCSSTIAGTIRYNSQTTFMEFCDGTAWYAMPKLQPAAPPTTPAGSGYFVLTASSWDGNLGGLSGANAKCLTEISSTYTDWAGYADANSRGLLTATKVKAFLCDNVGCNNLTPLATYIFAVAGQPAAGGASFSADASGLGPGDSTSWAAANRFNGSATYWMNRYGVPGNYWTNTPQGTSGLSTCGVWASNNSTNSGRYGNSSNTDYLRWNLGSVDCSTSLQLICLVNP